MHQHRLGRIAHADALSLGVQQDAHGHVDIGIFVDVYVAVAHARLNDRNSGVLHNVADERLTATGNEHVDKSTCFHQVVDRCMRLSRDQLDGIGSDTRGGQSRAHDIHKRRIGVTRRT